MIIKTTLRLLSVAMLSLMFLTPLPSKAQDDTASAPVNAPVVDFNDQPTDAGQLSAVVEEIRSLRKLFSEIRGDVAVLRKALEKRANVSRSAKKPLPYVIPPDAHAKIRIPARQSVLLDEGKPVARIAVADPGTVDVVQFTPEQIGLVGMKPGTTTVTVWFDDSRDPLIMLVTVYEAAAEPVSINVSNSPA
ncbi:MAG: pilus assembly protein N-terminal domain-containing protein [Planctomycetales bacterium]